MIKKLIIKHRLKFLIFLFIIFYLAIPIVNKVYLDIEYHFLIQKYPQDIIPFTPDARNIRITPYAEGDMLYISTYETDSSSQEIVKFYNEKLKYIAEFDVDDYSGWFTCRINQQPNYDIIIRIHADSENLNIVYFVEILFFEKNTVLAND